MIHVGRLTKSVLGARESRSCLVLSMANPAIWMGFELDKFGNECVNAIESFSFDVLLQDNSAMRVGYA